MAFLYGQGDNGGGTQAKQLEALLKGRQQLTGAVEVPGAAGQKGRKLLQPSLGTDAAIAGYLDNVLEKKIPERINRNYLKSQYAWGVPTRLRPNIWQLAKGPNDLTTNFNTYATWLDR
jgi:hypothetical protein